MPTRLANVESRAGQIIVSSWNVADSYLHVQGGWMEAIEESASDDVLGRLIRAALAASRTGVPTPDMRALPTPERRKLLKLAGVRSETQHARGRRVVKVAWEDPRPDLLITPWRGDGKRGGGAYELTSQSVFIDADAEDADLGTAVRQSLAAAESGP